MRKLIALLVAGLVAGPFAQAGAVGLPATRAPQADVLIFAGGGTQLTNGYFFPGTTVYEGGEYTGVPQEVPQGSNIQFVNLDHFVVAGGGHRIVSYDTIIKGKGKRAREVPLFASKMVDGPGQDTVKMSHVEPGVYRYFCPIHSGMLGTVEVK